MLISGRSFIYHSKRKRRYRINISVWITCAVELKNFSRSWKDMIKKILRVNRLRKKLKAVSQNLI